MTGPGDFDPTMGFGDDEEDIDEMVDGGEPDDEVDEEYDDDDTDGDEEYDDDDIEQDEGDVSGDDVQAEIVTPSTSRPRVSHTAHQARPHPVGGSSTSRPRLTPRQPKAASTQYKPTCLEDLIQCCNFDQNVILVYRLSNGSWVNIARITEPLTTRQVASFHKPGNYRAELRTHTGTFPTRRQSVSYEVIEPVSMAPHDPSAGIHDRYVSALEKQNNLFLETLVHRNPVESKPAADNTLMLMNMFKMYSDQQIAHQNQLAEKDREYRREIAEIRERSEERDREHRREIAELQARRDNAVVEGNPLRQALGIMKEVGEVAQSFAPAAKETDWIEKAERIGGMVEKVTPLFQSFAGSSQQSSQPQQTTAPGPARSEANPSQPQTGLSPAVAGATWRGGK